MRKNDLNVSGVYQIRNMVNGRLYVGSAVKIWNRWTLHRRQLSRGNHHSIVLQRAWEKYGEDSFDFSVLEFCDADRLIEVEQSFIDRLSPDYNIAPRAGSQLGYKHSQESRAKMAEAARRTRNFTGKRHSEETRRRISEAKKGKGLGKYGQDRIARAAEKMRASKGAIGESEVRIIRHLNSLGMPHIEVAQWVGRTYWAVSDCAQGRTFKWVK